MKEKDGKIERINDTLLRPIERPTLQWLAQHMPKWVSSDTLTVIGICGSILTLISGILAGQKGELYHNPWLSVVCLGFLINWFGDSLDGTLARYRHLERPNFGYFIDHSVDGFTAVCMFMAFGFAGICNIELAAFGTIGYLLMMITVYLKTHVTGVFEMTTIKLGPTEMRLLAVIFTLIYYFTKPASVNLPLLGSQTFGDVVVGTIAVILFIYYIAETVRVSIHLAAEDGKRLEKRLAKEAKEAAKKQKKLEKELKKSSKAKGENIMGNVSQID